MLMSRNCGVLFSNKSKVKRIFRLKLVKVIQNSGDCVAFEEKECAIHVSAIGDNFLFKFFHDNVCQHWTKQTTHVNTIDLFIHLVVARKDGFRTRVTDEFGKGRFLELRFDILLVVDSIYNDFQCWKGTLVKRDSTSKEMNS